MRQVLIKEYEDSVDSSHGMFQLIVPSLSMLCLFLLFAPLCFEERFAYLCQAYPEVIP